MGANLGVLASLTQSMAEANNIRPWDEAQRSMNQADTGLLQLQEMKRQQATAQRTRQFLQEHPELVLGQGGGSTIGSLQTAPAGPPGGAPMTQQSIVPGQPPGASQQVPGGQDRSRFAGVSPQGGGPIPPDVMGQVTPTVTPPQGMPTLATIGPQGQGPMQAPQNRLLELARIDPDTALKVQQQMQGQQQHQFKLEEQRLDWTSKKMGYFGQVLQGVNSPESYAQAVQEIARVDPQAAARLPQTYSKEGLIPYIRQATTVKENADLQIRTMHEQTENLKVQAQLAQAGYQGLGDDVTGIIRGMPEEQVKQFGGRTSPAAIAWATEEARKLKAPPGQTDAVTTELRKMGKDPWKAQPEDLTQAGKNIQDRELAKAGEAERLKFAQEQEQQKTLPLQDARKEDQDRFVYKGTGQTVPGTIPYGEVKTLQGEKDPNKAIVHLTTDAQKQLTNLKQLEPVLDQYRELVQYAYGPGGPMENFTRSVIPTSQVSAMWRQALQTDPKLEALRRSLMGQLQSVVRGLGARGDLNEAELKAATDMIANFDASAGLGLSLGPMAGPSGIGVGGTIKPSLSVPDNPQVGLQLANTLIDTVNKRVGSILQNDQYARTPQITVGRAGQPTGGAPQVPPGSLPPPPPPGAVPPRTWGVAPAGPQPGQPPAAAPAPTVAPGTPAPAAPATPAPAPVTPTGPPSPPTATSTPAQADAYRQWIRQQPAFTAPAPTATTPGRRSQAAPGASAVRVAGGPKFMELRDVQDAMRQTGRSRREVEQRARELGYTVYGSKLKLPEVTMVG